jgi:hypothetical protein
VKVLIDHNISPRIAHALSAFYEGKHTVTALRDKYSASTPDIEWTGALGLEGGWCVISADQRITRNRVERLAFRNARLTGFFMSSGLYKSSVDRQLIRLLTLWPVMETALQTIEGGALFELPQSSNKLKQIRL